MVDLNMPESLLNNSRVYMKRSLSPIATRISVTGCGLEVVLVEPLALPYISFTADPEALRWSPRGGLGVGVCVGVGEVGLGVCVCVCVVGLGVWGIINCACDVGGRCTGGAGACTGVLGV